MLGTYLIRHRPMSRQAVIGSSNDILAKPMFGPSNAEESLCILFSRRILLPCFKSLSDQLLDHA